MSGILEFMAQFGDERQCIEYLAALRWPDGYVCSKCGGWEAWRLKSRPRVYQCMGCAHQESVTSGTIFHRTRTPLPKWFLAAYLMGRDKRVPSQSLPLGFLVSNLRGIPFTHVATSDSVGGWKAHDIPSLGDIRSLGLITLGRFKSLTCGLAAKPRAVSISGGFAGRMALSAPTARQWGTHGKCRAACCAVEPAIGRCR